MLTSSSKYCDVEDEDGDAAGERRSRRSRMSRSTGGLSGDLMLVLVVLRAEGTPEGRWCRGAS
jgi:hypothetical protein